MVHLVYMLQLWKVNVQRTTKCRYKGVLVPVHKLSRTDLCLEISGGNAYWERMGEDDPTTCNVL